LLEFLFYLSQDYLYKEIALKWLIQLINHFKLSNCWLSGGAYSAVIGWLWLRLWL
jgi:hypothetical protein